MRPGRLLPRAGAGLLAAAAAACAPPAGHDSWTNGYGPDFCAAHSGAGTRHATVQLSRTPGISGIVLTAPAFDGLPPNLGQGDVVLSADSSPVRAAAAPARFRDTAGVSFAFNPRRLVRSHPDGFTLAAAHRGRTIYETRLSGTREAFDRLLECDLARLTGRPPPR